MNGKQRDISGLTADLENLSGRYGVYSRSSDFLVSNDKGYAKHVKQIKKWLKQPRDLALMVGSGGHLSMLPDMDMQAVILIDNNQKVLDFNRYLGRLILESDKPEDVMSSLLDSEGKTLEELKIMTGFGAYGRELREEMVEYGDDHWSAKQRFGKVKAALGRVPVVYLAANLTDADFQSDFNDSLSHHGHKISLLNLTNVQNYIDDKDIARRLPLDDDPLILYSKGGPRLSEGMIMGVARSADEYRDAIKT